MAAKPNRSLTTLAAGLIAVSLIPVGSFAEESWTARTPLTVESSLHALIVTGQPNGVTSASTPECLSAVRDLLQRGGDFHSQVVAENTVPLTEFPQPTLGQNIYYHYTNSPAVLGFAENQNFDGIFQRYRSPSPPPVMSARARYTLTARWFFYIANDTVSSRVHGRYRMRVTLNPLTRVFFAAGDRFREAHEGSPPQEAFLGRRQLVRRIEDELIARAPSLEACRSAPELTYINRGEQPLLVTLAAEAEHVGLLAYYGPRTWFFNARVSRGVPAMPRDVQWFEVLGPWAITELRLDADVGPTPATTRTRFAFDADAAPTTP